MARYEIPKGYTVAVVATMPRSGTWRSFYFLEFLDLFLSGRQSFNTRFELEVYDALRLGKVHVHAICPGFMEACRGEERRKWDALEFYVPGFNYGYGKFIEGNEQVFSPANNGDIRIVYIYRNPMDQCVSYFRHIEHHRKPSTRTYVDSDGTEKTIEDLKHYISRVGIDAYIKQYYTFHVMKRAYPGNITMITYEDMTRDPDGTFRSMLGFLNVSLDDETKETCFQKALNASSAESLRNLETAMGGSLARDQGDERESHMRGGKIGKWKAMLDDEHLELIRRRLGEFGLTVDDFVVE